MKSFCVFFVRFAFLNIAQYVMGFDWKIRREKKVLQVNIVSYQPMKICFIFKVGVLKNMNIEF